VKRPRAAILAIIVPALALLAWPAVVLAETVERVSVDTAGNDANDTSFSGSIDEDGRYVAFSSDADDLVPTDAYGFRDIFVRDLVADTPELVSVDSDEVQGNDDSYHPSISPDGRYVAFQSLADNLVAGDTNTASDVFVRDLVDGVTSRVNVSSDGTHAKYGWSGSPSITTDDEFVYVAYCSDATNLTDDDTNGKADVFVSYFDKDLPSAITTRRASVNTDGTEDTNRSLHPRIAVDGGNVYVAYISDASDLVGGDTNKASDIFVSFLDKANLDTSSVVTQRVSVTSGGGQSSGGGEPDSRSSLSISADGRYVAYDSWADDLVGGDTNGKWDVFVTDWNKSDPGGIVTERVSVATDGSQAGANVSAPSISGDGRYVAFKSLANNLVEDDTNGKADVFVRDRMAQTTVLVSTTSNGGLGNGASGGGSITPSAGDALPMVVFGSDATNLVAGATDENGVHDVFVAAVPAVPEVPTRTGSSGKSERYEQTDARFLYQGGWKVEEHESHSGGSMYYTDGPEATLTITFKGSRVDWIATMGPQMGAMWISVDGGEPVLVDLHSDTELFQQMVWSTGTLKYGVHVIKIRLAALLTPEQTNGVIMPVNLDALDVYGELF
jgi:hypothetical protein